MDFSREDAILAKDAMLSAMIGGILSDPPWQAFVRELRLAFDASHANVIFRRPDLRQMFLAHSSSAEVERFGSLVDLHDPAADPIPYFRMLPFRAYRVEEFLGGCDPGLHPFTGGFLTPLGMDRLAICRVQTTTGMQAWISVTRGGTFGFDNAELARLEQTALLFAEALTVFGACKDIEDERDAYSRVAFARATGVARLDEQGKVIHLDANARTWINEGRYLCIAGERLAAVRPADEASLRGAVGRILSGASAEECVVLDGSGPESLELLFYRFADPFETARAVAPRVIVYMGMIGRESPPSPERLRGLFGLTRREAALTILLVRGQTLGDAAMQLGVSDQTARAYLRQVFRKTGVARQAQLIRRIQGSIAGIA